MFYRTDCLNDHFARIRNGSETNIGARYYAKTGLHITEAVTVIDHFKSNNLLKVMTEVTGSQFYSFAMSQMNFP